MRLEHDVPHGMPVRADEPAALVVEGQAVLTLSARELERTGSGMEAGVARRKLHSAPLGMRRGHDAPAVEAAGEVDPAVGPQRRVAETNLRRAIRIETGECDTTLVRHAIAVGVLQVQQ